MSKKLITGALALLLLGGCVGGTTDPRQGGLFSYNPEAYEQRLEERRNFLASEDYRAEENESQRLSLESEKSDKAKKLAAEKKRLNALRADLQRSQNRLNNYTAKNARQQRELEDLRARQSELLRASRSLGDVDTEQKRAELARLRQEADRLKARIDKMNRILD